LYFQLYVSLKGDPRLRPFGRLIAIIRLRPAKMLVAGGPASPDNLGNLVQAEAGRTEAKQGANRAFFAHLLPLNTAPAGFDASRDLPKGFVKFLMPLHREFTPRHRILIDKRAQALDAAHKGDLPDYLPPSKANQCNWHIDLPAWCEDQRNQMTGPADDAELVVKMLNSGAPGVMLDLEDSMANAWPHLMGGIQNILAALKGELSYFDSKRQRTVAIAPSKTAIWIRPRGLRLRQAGVLQSEEISASLFDVATIAFHVNPSDLKHPLTFYIPKSESAEEALWWRDLFQAIASALGWPAHSIKCMALVESHPLAYQMEEFAYNLRDHLLGLNLGRWDYMASLAHFNFEDSRWVLPDRNTIPHDVAFFQNLRTLMPEICHKHGLLAIGGMTALYPSREDAELNARALDVLRADKRNEANSLMDGAWTGHPDQNEIAVSQFPAPNQIHSRPVNAELHRDLRPIPSGAGKHTLAGTRAAVRTVIRYRHGVLRGRGASLLDGYMEDLATDRIYRIMIAQRMNHRSAVRILDEDGKSLAHTPELISHLFDEELKRILRELPADSGTSDTELFTQARVLSEQMILSREFDPN
jgi:malate synthase